MAERNRIYSLRKGSVQWLVPTKPVSKLETYLKYGFVLTETECHYCPRCKNILNAGPNYQPKYCAECGQRLSFKDIEWKREKELGYKERGGVNEQVKNCMV